MARKALVLDVDGRTRKERRAERRALRERTHTVEDVEQKTKLVFPPAPGPSRGIGMEIGGYDGLIPLHVEQHHATSQHVGGIYPFVADSGIGTAGPVLGVDENSDTLWHFSPWTSYQDNTDRGAFSTNILVLGAYRAGKSATVKTLVYRSMAFGHQAVVPSDSKGEWVPLAEATEGGVVYRLGGLSNDRINPLARPPFRTGATEDEDRKLVQLTRLTTLITLVEMAARRTLTEETIAALTIALTRAVEATSDRPTLRTVFAEIETMVDDEALRIGVRQGAETAGYTLERFVHGDLSGIFEDESTVEFDDAAPIVVVDTSELFQRSELVAQMTAVCTTAWIQAVISDRAAKRTRYIIREEGWRDMTSVRQLEMYQQWLKLSRHYGVSNVVILHKVGDVDAVGEEGSKARSLAYSLIGDIENKFVFRVNQQEVDNLRHRLNLPPAHTQLARGLRKGEFISYVGRYAYVVDCFATSTTEEYELFKTDDAMMTDRDVPMREPEDVTWDIDDLWPAVVGAELERTAATAAAEEWIEAVKAADDERNEEAA